MYPRLDAVAVIPADGKELDSIAEFPGEVYVDGLDGADALNRYVIEVNMLAIGNGHQDRQFMGGINPFNVIGRVGFGKSLLLGISEYFVKWRCRVRSWR